MDWPFIAAVTYLLAVAVGMTLLMRRNLRVLRETKYARLTARRIEKRKRNEQLRKLYELDKKD